MWTYFISGIVVGSLISTITFLFTARKMARMIIGFLQAARIENLALECLKSIDEITKTQLDLMTQLERPNASAAHSRHKSKISNEIFSLEEDKRKFLQKILDLGLDPKIQVMTPLGGKMSMNISEFLKNAPALTKNNNNTPPKTDSIHPRLKLIEGDNDEPAKRDDSSIH